MAVSGQCTSNRQLPAISPGSVCLIECIADSCGSAGGRLPGEGNGDNGRGYMNTTFAKLADLGSKTLKPFDSGTIWTVGEAVEVAWTQEAWHGGGNPPCPPSLFP